MVTVCATNVTLGNLSSLTLQQEMIMAIQTGGSALPCIPSLRGHSRSAASLGLITQPTLCECNRSGLKFPFAHSGWHYRCSVTLATQQWMTALMGSRLLLRNPRHRTIITPVNPLRLWLIHISTSYQTVYRSLEIILEWVAYCPLDSNSNPNFLCKPTASKKHSICYELNWKKYLIAEGSSGSSGWARVKSERTYSRELLLRTIRFDARHLQIARGKPTWNENIWTDKVQCKKLTILNQS